MQVIALPKIFQIDVGRKEIDKAELKHITNNEHRSTVENLINSYKPDKVKETGVKMSIILKDEKPVYQRARRLSAVEREKVNKIISEWIQNDIVQPSLSDYATPVVLAEKKRWEY